MRRITALALGPPDTGCGINEKCPFILSQIYFLYLLLHSGILSHNPDCTEIYRPCGFRTCWRDDHTTVAQTVFSLNESTANYGIDTPNYSLNAKEWKMFHSKRVNFTLTRVKFHSNKSEILPISLFQEWIFHSF